MTPVNQEEAKRARQENTHVTYGESVKRRRLEAVEKLANGDKSLSISQRRKLVVRAEKEQKNPIKSYERKCNTAYNQLLQCLKKDKDQAKAKVSQLLTVVLEDEEAPLLKFGPETEPEIIAREYFRPCVSRSLQIALKSGNASHRETIVAKVKPVFIPLCQTNTGHHLCMKLFTYAKDKKEVEELFEHLLAHPRTFFTKFGSRVWDCAARKMGTSKHRQKMLMKLFFEKVVGNEIADCLNKPVEEALLASSEMVQNVAKEKFLEIVDKAVRKELLASELIHHLMCILTRMRGFVDDEMFMKVSEAVFEGSDAMLTTREGVWFLNRICGFWSAKDRKTFLSNIKSSMALNETSWSAYFMNDVDSLFVTRLLETIDDTKLSIESILAPIFNVKWKNGKLKMIEKGTENYQIYDILFNPRAVAMLVRLTNPPEVAKRFLTQHDLQQLDYPSPTSKKCVEQRRLELGGFFKQLATLIDRERIAQRTDLSEKHKNAITAFFDSISSRSQQRDDDQASATTDNEDLSDSAAASDDDNEEN